MKRKTRPPSGLMPRAGFCPIKSTRRSRLYSRPSTAHRSAWCPACLSGADSTCSNLFPVAAQCVPDGDFPTCPKPNPEEKPALNEAVKLANETAADILIATDPDADRLGVGVRLKDGEKSLYADDAAVKDGYYLLTGNQQLVLLTDYILSQTIARDGTLPANSVISKTLVSTDLAKSDCRCLRRQND